MARYFKRKRFCRFTAEGVEEIATAALTKSEYSAIVATYTAGGMTLTGKLEEAENVAGGTASVQDQEYWMIGAAFAF